MRTYEVMFIVRPDISDEDLDRLVSTLESQAGTAGGTVKSVERMGKRRMAYMVRKFNEGLYVLFIVESETGSVIAELERRLRVAEPVIKFQTVRVDQEQKRIDKIKADRESRKKARPAPVPAAPAAEAEPAPAGAEPAPATT